MIDKFEFLAAVNSLIKENRQTYLNFPKRIISDYNNENGSIKEYNGRQILELLQNADDANSKSVNIIFDKDERRLSIANVGEPFSVGGIQSLMLANLSTKNKKIFIGNKGLGFRSILSWADKIIIKTNNCTVEFSKEIAKKEFDLAVKTQSEKESLLAELGLTENTIPFPTLAIPKIDLDETPESSWTTIIEIYYKKEFEINIQLQLEDCKEEILLFLNNIETIKIDGVSDKQIVYIRVRLKENDLTYIQIRNKIWRIETMENFLPEHLQDKSKIEKESFNITVAFQDDLSDKYYKLFNYFPTKLSIYLPCIIHATFELNSSRDYINTSVKNEFIFEQLVDLLKKCSLNLARETEGKADWGPFKLLLPLSSTTDSPLIDAFYTNLKKLQDLLQVFPCVNGSYEDFGKVKYYDSAFSEWVKINDFKNHFPSLLIPEEKSIAENFLIGMRCYSQNEFTEIIDGVSKEIQEIKPRAELIAHLLQISLKQNRDEIYSILVNKENEVIDKVNVAFTPIIETEAEFKRPDFIHLDFINKDLYDVLVIKYKNEFKPKEPDSREFQRLFSKIANIQPYDSNAVITRIINGTKDKIRAVSNETALVYIKEMVQALFSTYKMLKYKDSNFSETCPLINSRNEIKDSGSLFLNSSFPSGVLTEKIFEGILTDQDYLAGVDLFEINNSDLMIKELFFIWLGVNKNFQHNVVNIFKNAYEVDPYLDFVFSTLKRPNPVTKYSFTGKGIGLLKETVYKLSNEKLIFFILKDDRIYQSLLGNITSDNLSYQYGQNYPFISGNASYISFQLKSLKRFDNYLVDNNEIPFINDFEFDYAAPMFKEYAIEYHDIDFVLGKLGAMRSFIELPTERVYELIKQCGDLEAEHKHTRWMYLQAFDHFRSPKMKATVSIEAETKLLAIRYGKKDYRPFQEVYYSDNSILPEKIIKELWVLDFPKRAGESQVAKYFGVKTFKELKVDIDDLSIKGHEENLPFNEWINRIKPLILTYRLSSLRKLEDKKEAAKAIKRSSIRIISNVDYTTDGVTFQKLGHDEFIINENQFLMSVEDFKNLEQCRDSSKFCNAFAEMMCILFKVNENKNNYISVFKDKVEFSKSLIKSDSLEEFLDEAYSLLGLSQNETGLWEVICKIKSIQLPENIENEDVLRKFLKIKFNYDLPDDYKLIDFDEYDNVLSFNFLKSICIEFKISIGEIKQQFQSFPGIKAWHLNRMTDFSRDIENRYSNTVWDNLSSENIVEQKTFINKRNKFRNWFNLYRWTDIELPPFILELDYMQILEKKVKSEFHVILCNSESPILILPIYQALLSKHDEIEKSFSEEQKSLLYFEGNIDEIKSYLANKNIMQFNEEDSIIITDSIFSIIEAKLSATIPTVIKGKGNNYMGSGAFDPNSEKVKRKAGKKAELKVRNSLVELYGRKNVQWVSGNSDEDKPNDALGYDFLYRKSETDEWCFLEVKSVTGNTFIISNNEFRVALKNKEKYHLALVKTEQIIIDKDFFKNLELENTYNSLNSSTIMRPCNFEVFFS